MRRHFLPTVLALLSIAGCAQEGPEFDVLIIGGEVYDGSGERLDSTAIGISGTRIVTLNADANAGAGKTIDARGLVVMPGFIDPHTHALSGAPDEGPLLIENYLRQGVTTVFVGSDGRGLDEPDRTLAEFDARGLGPNIAYLAGHGRIRESVMGMSDRPPDDEELATMRAMLEERMQIGAFGLSSGLFYAPGSFADVDEVVELARVAARHGGIYDTHMRDESSYNIGLLASIEETIHIGREANIPVHISHLKALGKDVWGSAPQIVDLVERARAEGIDVTANQYPWRASGTRFSNAILPRWAKAADYDPSGERENPQLRLEMSKNLERRGGPAAMLVTDARSEYQGKRLDEIAAAIGVEPIDAALTLARGDDPSIASFVMDPADIELIAMQPWVVTGSDGSRGHPRLFASYPKAWQDLVASGARTNAEFARRSASQVAEIFHICERGFLRDGYFADIVLINPDEYLPLASYEQPTLMASGVHTLVVNGVVAIDEYQLTGKTGGRALRKTVKACSE